VGHGEALDERNTPLDDTIDYSDDTSSDAGDDLNDDSNSKGMHTPAKPAAKVLSRKRSWTEQDDSNGEAESPQEAKKARAS